MNPPLNDYVTLVEVLELTRPFEEVGPLVQEVVQRLAREGVRELVSMQFYTDEAANQLGAVITFSSSSQMMAHVKMIAAWEEFKRFATMIRVVDMRVHGKLNPEAEAWIRQFNGPLRKLERLVAGFSRRGPH